MTVIRQDERPWMLLSPWATALLFERCCSGVPVWIGLTPMDDRCFVVQHNRATLRLFNSCLIEDWMKCIETTVDGHLCILLHSKEIRRSVSLKIVMKVILYIYIYMYYNAQECLVLYKY